MLRQHQFLRCPGISLEITSTPEEGGNATPDFYQLPFKTKEEEVVLRLEASRMVVNFTLLSPLK